MRRVVIVLGETALYSPVVGIILLSFVFEVESSWRIIITVAMSCPAANQNMRK